MPGRFITFEGVEGCGKSTQLDLLSELMKDNGLPVVTTREPGGTELGQRVREVLLSPAGGKVSPVAELFLFDADRAQHVAEVIRPNLESGINVLCDRFYDSTTAYQAFGRGLPDEQVCELNTLATGGLVPDLTILLDIDPREGLKRVLGDDESDSFQLLLFAREGGARPQRKRGQERVREARGLDTMEAEAIDFHQRVREGFLELSRREPDRIRLVPAGSIEEVHARVCAIITEAFGWTGNSLKAKTQP